MTTLAGEIRAALKNSTGALSAADIFLQCESATSVDQVTLNLYSFIKRDEVLHKKSLTGSDGTYEYNAGFVPGRAFSGQAETSRMVKGKSMSAGGGSLGRPRAAPTPPRMPVTTAKMLERVVDKVEADKKPAKRKYKKRTPPQALPVPIAERIATALPAPIALKAPALFAIRDDGMVGISLGTNAVSLPPAEVQRLQDFLKTVSPLWSNQ